MNFTSGHTKSGLLTTSSVDILVNQLDQNLTFEVVSFLASNVSGTEEALLDATFHDHASGKFAHITLGLVVPPKDTAVVIGRDSLLYLEKGDKIQAKASHNDFLDYIISYRILQG